MSKVIYGAETPQISLILRHFFVDIRRGFVFRYNSAQYLSCSSFF